ncbi:hypothetical protein [Enteractinococcus coprophilus]|uniref:PknH-like protein n=1 Tax=Enteractinococcus coprophilus TaxID=1027633 RepID=A0A543AK37_9MICC|nr:hypothetical protein [Enteractinococcus coprophilus]TQL72954.1 hypothetical protein FB556_1627 [Enteractinococcus coprophilus]
MKRPLSLLAVALLSLTACTDQPAPVEPEATATVTETVTAEPTDNLASPDRAAATIEHILDSPPPAEMTTGEEAISGLENVVTLSDDEHSCPLVADPVPEVATLGMISADEDNPEAVRGLAAFGFNTVADATAFSEHFQTVLQECEAATYEIVPLTHHTDEAIEIQVETSDESAASLVVLRNEFWVLMAVSTPPADLALSLTQVDQLDEMLR